ncbi:MAG TPA: TerB family tellurite resistance protein [Myxococcota bacterium]|nr:TerB family tellurite resistance protein [Myxococcota bacterium]
MSNIARPSDRPRRKKRAEEAPESHVLELAAIGELMLGAAWSDGRRDAVEIVAIAEQLKEFVDMPELPSYVVARMEGFDPSSFSVEEAAGRLRFEDDGDRLGVLKLLARVAGADRHLHEGELDYLKRFASAVGLDPDSIRVEIL